MPYRAPINEFSFIFDNIVGLGDVASTPLYEDATHDVVTAILAEAAKLSDEKLAPVNRSGDEHHTVLENGVMRAAPGYGEAYQAIAEGGWVGIAARPESRWHGPAHDRGERGE